MYYWCKLTKNNTIVWVMYGSLFNNKHRDCGTVTKFEFKCGGKTTPTLTDEPEFFFTDSNNIGLDGIPDRRKVIRFQKNEDEEEEEEEEDSHRFLDFFSFTMKEKSHEYEADHNFYKSKLLSISITK